MHATTAPAPPNQEHGSAGACHLLQPLLAAHVVAWTLFPILSYWPGSLPHDMTEAWAWGQEFQLGYFKHPPFYAWLAAIWFQILPRNDLAYYVLAALVSAGGLAGVWMLARRFLDGPSRAAAVLLLALAPFHGVMAVNFNANSIQLLLWPWTAYFFVRAIETTRLIHGIAFGALAAASLLSKYYSAILIAACAMAALLHPDRARIWRSPAPYAAAIVAGLLLAPHVWWIAKGGQSLTYAGDRFGFNAGILAMKVAITGLQGPAFFALPIAAFLAVIGPKLGAEQLRRGCVGLAAPQHRWLAALAFGPYLLTLVAGTIGTVKISWNYLIPAFYMVPIAILAGAKPQLAVTAAQSRSLAHGVWAYLTAALLVAPVIAMATFTGWLDLGRTYKETAEPRREIALEANRLWRQAFGDQPLRIIAANAAWGHGISFYAPDAPSDFTWFDLKVSPWVTPQRIAREGLLIACVADDEPCFDAARAFTTAATQRATVSLARTWLGREGRRTNFVLFLVPPKPIP